jgi:hypothetical protein
MWLEEVGEQNEWFVLRASDGHMDLRRESVGTITVSKELCALDRAEPCKGWTWAPGASWGVERMRATRRVKAPTGNSTGKQAIDTRRTALQACQTQSARVSKEASLYANWLGAGQNHSGAGNPQAPARPQHSTLGSSLWARLP